MAPLRILVADDHQVVRTGLRTLLESKAGWKVCAEAANGREGVEKAGELSPDVAVLDIGMPLLNGVEATRQIRKVCPATEVLILTMQAAVFVFARFRGSASAQPDAGNRAPGSPLDSA